MGKYAKDTSVSSESSRAEIERTLTRYGANAFGYGWDEGQAVVTFRLKGLFIRFVLVMPDRNAEEFKRTPARNFVRSPDEAYKAWEQACRQKWRALALVIKAKLEAVESGITQIEYEFMANIVLPDSRTVGQAIMPEISEAYKSGRMPKMLLALPGPEKEDGK